MTYSNEDLKILFKKISGYNASDTKNMIIPVIKRIINVLRDDDKIITLEMNSQIGLKPCVFVLLQDRILYIDGVATHELYIENIASFQKSQIGISANIKISDSGNKTFDFKNFSLKNSQIIIDFLQKKLDIDKVINEHNELPLNIEDYKSTLYRCLFGGFLGLHRFYTGYIWIGILQILLFIFCLPLLIIWWLIDCNSIITNKFETIDGFKLNNYEEKDLKIIAIPIIISVLFVICKLSIPDPTLLNKPDMFTIKELQKSINKAYNLKDVQGGTLPALYKNSTGSKNSYKYGFFKLQAPENGFKKYAVVCECNINNKTVIPFWQGFYNKDGILFQEFNYIKTNEIKSVPYNTNSNLKIMWNTLCAN